MSAVETDILADADALRAECLAILDRAEACAAKVQRAAAELTEQPELTTEDVERIEKKIGESTPAMLVAVYLAMHGLIESQSYGATYRVARYQRLIIGKVLEAMGRLFDDEGFPLVADGMALWQEMFGDCEDELSDEAGVDVFLSRVLA